MHLPQDASYDEKKNRMAIARRLFLRIVSDATTTQDESTDRPVISLIPGDRVQHNVFGYGTVVSAFGSGPDAEATIDFEEGVGVKQLMLRYAPLEKR